MDRIDHVAIVVKDLEETLTWYLSHFNAKLIYQDDTWAMIEFQNIKLAFVVPHQHPPHIAFNSEKAESFGKLKQHRDGTLSCYAKDPSGNIVEFIKS
ncbi:MAG: VOC family protein [Proteobacteria bacterium]|nr:VOC family protein [Pseudomonadota bacterium]